MLLGRSSMTGNTVAPVVVKPDTDSKNAAATVGATPVVMNGTLPTTTTPIHPSPTTAIPSRGLMLYCLGVSHQTAPPNAPVPTKATSHGTARPSVIPNATAGAIAAAVHTNSAPTR